MRLKPIALFIEDDPMFRKAMESVLGRLGMNVKAVGSSQEFFESAKKLKPDIFLIDLQLDEENGFDVISKLREEMGQKEKIIVVSGAKDTASIEKALSAGANDFITKPLDRIFLVSKLSKYVMTEELKDQANDLKAVPDGGATPGKLTFRAKVSEVDELGVRLISPALIPCGTVLKMSTGFLEGFNVASHERLVTVTSSWFNSDSQTYGAYAEFDGVDLPFLEQIRSWLSQDK